MLDIGCGVGNFLAFATKREMRAVGSEVEPQAVATARALGLEAYEPHALDQFVPPNSVDLGTMWDVIEHVATPSDLLHVLVEKVRPAGAVLLETPDASFPARPLLRFLHIATKGRVRLSEYMYYWEHKVYFTRRGLIRLLSDAGVDVVEVLRMPSPQSKMAQFFRLEAAQGSTSSRVLALWPLLSRTMLLGNWGNKLIVLGRKR